MDPNEPTPEPTVGMVSDSADGFASARRIDVGGTTLAFEEQGAGPAVVFVHGGLSDLRMWRPQLAGVAAAGHRAIAYSRRGHAPNGPVTPDRYTFSTHVEDLAALLPALGAAPAVLVGHSYGGSVCLYLARRHPQMVRGLVLAEPNMVPLLVGAPPRPSLLLKALARDPFGTAGLLRVLVGGIVPTKKAFEHGDDEAALQLFISKVVGVSGAPWPEAIDNAPTLRAEFLSPTQFEPFDDGDAALLSTPTLLLMGGHSRLFLRSIVRRLARELPRCEGVTVIPGGTHNFPLEQPAAFAAAIQSSLR